MGVFLKWLLRIVAVLAIVAIAIGIWKREEITRLLAVNSLFEEDKIISNFSNMNKAFLWTEVPRGDGPVSELDVTLDLQLDERLRSLRVDLHVELHAAHVADDPRARPQLVGQPLQRR